MASHIEVTVSNHGDIHKEMLPTINMKVISSTCAGRPFTELEILGRHYSVTEAYEEVKAMLVGF